MHNRIDYASTSLFGQSVALPFFHTFLEFYNFRKISLWSLQTLYFLFVCLFHFVFSWLIDFTKHFINIIFNAGTAKSATTNAYFADIGGTCNEFVRTINNFIFNLYIQFIIADLKTSLHLTPFCLLDLILAIINNQNFPIIWLAVWFPAILNILSLFFRFRVKNHLYNYGTQLNDK